MGVEGGWIWISQLEKKQACIFGIDVGSAQWWNLCGTCKSIHKNDSQAVENKVITWQSS